LKEKEKTSIVTVVSLEPCSRCERWIVMQRTDSSTVELIPLVGVTRAGIDVIRTHGWRWMLELSGLLEIEEKKVTGGKTKRSKK